MARTNSTVNMTQGPIKRMILKFAFPIFLSQLLQQLYNAVDAMIVGQVLGKQALAAVTSSGNLIFLFVSFFTGTTMGAGVVISRYFGAGDEDQVSKAIHTNVALGLIFGIVLTVLGVGATPTILRWMGTAESVLPSSIIYFRYYFIGVIAIVMYNVFTGIMTAVGDSRRPLYYLLISSVLNIVLDLLFVAVFNFGVGGAAMATTLSQMVSCILCYITLRREKSVCHIEFKKIRIHTGLVKEIMKYGVPSGVQNSVISFANVMVQTFINSFGENAMAAYGSHSKIEGFVFLPITCFMMALTTFISQNLGAREYDRAKAGARFGLTTLVIIAEAIGVFTFIFSPQLFRIFTNDAEVIALGVQQSRTVTLFYGILAFSHCVAAICRGAGKAVVPMVVMLTTWCVIRIIYITIAMNISHDIQLLYDAYPLTWIISTIIYAIYYKHSDWIHGYDARPGKSVGA